MEARYIPTSDSEQKRLGPIVGTFIAIQSGVLTSQLFAVGIKVSGPPFLCSGGAYSSFRGINRKKSNAIFVKRPGHGDS